jgi:hypothetical protein
MRGSLLRVWAFAPLLAGGCAASTSSSATPEVAPFLGVETEQWLVQESDPMGRDDLLPAFEASARSYGCGTEQLGRDSNSNIFGERRSYYGIRASCDEGTIALLSLSGGRIVIGCTKPTTREACDSLLRNISQAR